MSIYTVGLTLLFFALTSLTPIHITVKLCPPQSVVYMGSFQIHLFWIGKSYISALQLHAHLQHPFN